jgi:Spy/CpxP family protein refolding chaperone
MKKGWLAISLIAIFLTGIVAYNLMAQPAQGQRMMGLRPGAQLLKDALQLTPEQEKKLQEFRQARLQEAKAFREKKSQMRQDLRKLMADPNADENKINGLIDQISKLRAERMKAQFKNRKEWEKIFTPEQLKKIKEYRQDFRLRRNLLMGPGGHFRRPMMFRRWGFGLWGWR